MFELKKIEAEWRARMHKALNFDGVDDYVDTNALRTDLGITTEYTIAVWFKLSIASGEWQTVIGDWGDPGAGRTAHLGIHERSNIIDNYVYLNSKQYHVSSGIVAQEGVWYHVVSTLKIGTSFEIYINGELKGSTDLSGTTSFTDSPTHTFKIGNRGDGRNNFKGTIGEVCIYNRALSESEIKYLYHNPFDPIDPEHLVLWLNPAGIDVANSKWWDLSGKGNHGTIHGATEVKLVEEEIEIR